MCVFLCRFFLQRFVPGARTLTEEEAKRFISAADDNSDGRIGAEGWYLISHCIVSVVVFASLLKKIIFAQRVSTEKSFMTCG